MQISDLPQYTVRLQVAGESGTGFFVAPGMILTCYHVVREAKYNGLAIAVYWCDREYTAEIEKLPADPEKFDLALLKLVDFTVNHSHLFLHEDIQHQDRLYTIGYTDDYPKGDPRDFTYIGLTGDKPPFLTFQEGQVQPGFSGAPLFNLRTRKVCGLIKRTRDAYSDLGGRGIPIQVIFDCFPELVHLHQTSPPTPLLQGEGRNISPNPFIPRNGIIDNPQHFFGRQKEIRQIFETLNSGSSIAIIGERGIGKSSLLKAICQQAETELTPSRKPIYLNLQLVGDEKDFYEALCYEINIEVCKGYALTRALKKQHPQLLLVLDEIEKMAWKGFTNQVRGQLRGLAEGGDAPLRLVVAASTSLDRLFPDSNQIGMTSPFKGICIEENLELWQEEIIHDFINIRLENTPIRFTEAEISQIINKSRGHPRELMELCYQAYQRYTNSA
jgi:hypothetical protein